MGWLDDRTSSDTPPVPKIKNLDAIGKKYGFEAAESIEGAVVSLPAGMGGSDFSEQFIDSWISQNPESGRIENDRRQKYNAYTLMDSILGVGIMMLDAYADEGLGVGFIEAPIDLQISDPEISDFVNTVFHNNRVFENARGFFRNLIKWGDLGIALDFPKNNPVPEAMRLVSINPNRWQALIPTDNKTPFQYKLLDNLTQFTWNYRRKGRTRTYNPWEFVHLTIPDLDYQPYGRSVLEPVRTSFDQLMTIEALLAMSRASKVERLVIKVPVQGANNPTAAFSQLSAIKNQWKNVVFNDKSMGARTYAKNPALTDILMFPSGPDYSIDKIQSTIDISSTDDVEYFRINTMMLTGLPRGYYMSDQAQWPRGVSLQAQDIKFARKLIPLQYAFCYGIVKLATIIAAYTKRDLSNITISARIKRPPQVAEQLLDTYMKISTTASQLLANIAQFDQPQMVPQGPGGMDAGPPVMLTKEFLGTDPKKAYFDICRILGMPNDVINAMLGKTNAPLTGDNPFNYITASNHDVFRNETILSESIKEGVRQELIRG